MKALINHLNSPLINVAEICRVCEINPGFMSGVLNGSRPLPQKHLWPIMRALCGEDGFILNGHVVRFEDYVFITSKPTGEEPKIEEVASEDSSHFVYHVPTYRSMITSDDELIDFINSL